MDNNEEFDADLKDLDKDAWERWSRKTRKKLVKIGKIAEKAPEIFDQMGKFVREHDQQIATAEERGEQRIKKQISERNSRNASKKSEKGQTLAEIEYVFNEAKQIMNGKNKEMFYHNDGSINMAKLAKEITFKRAREGKVSKTEKTYVKWLLNEEYIKKYGDWK